MQFNTSTTIQRFVIIELLVGTFHIIAFAMLQKIAFKSSVALLEC